MSEHVETCLNLFRFNMIWIVTIIAILKHVWTCSSMSKLVQIQYDTNCYNYCNSQTCLNMFKHVLTCSGSIWYELIQFINIFRLKMKTWRNTLNLSKWHEENSHWWKAIPWIASSKSSDQKFSLAGARTHENDYFRAAQFPGCKPVILNLF